MDLYKKTEKFVEDSFGKSGMTHFRRAVFWVRKLYPEAGEELLIAAISHDIERAFRKDEFDQIGNCEKGFLDEERLRHHQEEGAEIVFDFLIREGADEDLAKRVRRLVEKHEEGGDREQNILKDADSISFFENNIEYFVKDKVNETSRERVKEKFDWMFNRITSVEAKAISKKWYDEAMKKLGY